MARIHRFPVNVMLLFLCIYGSSLTSALPHRFKHTKVGGLLGAPGGVVPGSLPPNQWITQSLDHFNHADTRSWQQRYFVNATFYKPGGPVFLMIGGEGTASPRWMVTGAWIKYARMYNAMCFQLEHRYYGKSHPTPDISSENLAYLSSEQALADLAYFRNSMVMEHQIIEGAKWIAFGGSYPGALAAWARLKYPHLIHGSVSTSAPLLAKINFKRYMEVVKDSLETTGPGCNEAIARANEQIISMIQSPHGRAFLMDIFDVCKPIDIHNTDDISNFFESLAGNFADIVQYNRDNRAFEGSVMGNITIDTLCDMMRDRTKGSEVQRYANINTLMLKTHKEKCLDISYRNMVDELRNTSWAASASAGGRQWIYQTCTEFGYYQTSDLNDQPFAHKFPLPFYIQQCQDIYGLAYTEDVINKGIRRTNDDYGAMGIKVTRVVFPNGSIDPWHVLAVTEDLSEDATAIFINGTAHCANMYPDAPDDPPQLREARVQIAKLIGKWLQEDD